MIKKFTIKITKFFPADRPQGWKDWRQAQSPNQDAGTAERAGQEGTGPMPRSQALVLANEILNRLNGYARKGSRTRNNFYQRDLNWMAEVLMRIEAGERDRLRPRGQ